MFSICSRGSPLDGYDLYKPHVIMEVEENPPVSDTLAESGTLLCKRLDVGCCAGVSRELLKRCDDALALGTRCAFVSLSLALWDVKSPRGSVGTHLGCSSRLWRFRLGLFQSRASRLRSACRCVLLEGLSRPFRLPHIRAPLGRKIGCVSTPSRARR